MSVRDKEKDELDLTIERAFTNIRNAVLEAVMEIIEHEIELTGDGRNCLKRIRHLHDDMNRQRLSNTEEAIH